MVLLCGIPGDNPFELIGDALDQISYPYVVLNQRHFNNMDINYSIADGQLEGELIIGKDIYRLEDFTGIYNRAVAYQTLPEYKALSSTEAIAQQCAGFHDALFKWFDVTSARVLNRNFYMSSNASKPYQQLRIAANGFNVPATLITNQLEEVKKFREEQGVLIFKSASGVRSVVQELNNDYEQQLWRIQSCPTMFQQKLEGTNIRVHVVGNRLFPTKITSDRVDYRYAAKSGGFTTLETYELPLGIAEKCIAMSADLGLTLAGIDLFLSNDGDWYCFEVNPSPGFSYFQDNTGQPISTAIAEFLSGKTV